MPDPPTGGSTVKSATTKGGFGARPVKDGINAVSAVISNMLNTPIEILEMSAPLRVEEYALVPDSGGAGTWRGGMGLRRVYRAEAACRVELDMARMRSAPWGLAGGAAGGMGRIDCGPGVAPLAKGQGALAAGQVFGIVTPGAGGYGPPAARDPALAARDLAEGR